MFIRIRHAGFASTPEVSAEAKVGVGIEATTVAIPGFDAITLEPLTLLRPVDPADTALAEQVCQVANDADQHGKLKGRRLTEAVEALNALGGTWQLAPWTALV